MIVNRVFDRISNANPCKICSSLCSVVVLEEDFMIAKHSFPSNRDRYFLVPNGIIIMLMSLYDLRNS